MGMYFWNIFHPLDMENSRWKKNTYSYVSLHVMGEHRDLKTSSHSLRSEDLLRPFILGGGARPQCPAAPLRGGRERRELGLTTAHGSRSHAQRYGNTRYSRTTGAAFILVTPSGGCAGPPPPIPRERHNIPIYSWDF